MPVDYVLFIHGVSNRNMTAFKQSVDKFAAQIRRTVNDPSREIVPIPVFWGDLSEPPQKELGESFQASSVWNDIWFKEFRLQQVLPFVGDAALYLSRHVGSKFVQRFKEVALEPLKKGTSEDRLHCVTHSWGTVVLFDLLFASRWESTSIDPAIAQTVQNIRQELFGLKPNAGQGLPIASIHTMGSPLALFSLITIGSDMGGKSSHDLAPQLKELLDALYARKGGKLPWCNFIHPGDPIAYPLEKIIPLMLDGNNDKLDTIDIITDKGNLFNQPFLQTLIPMAWGGQAHGSYWSDEDVFKKISQVICDSVRVNRR
jgi:hypothetical protein